MKKIIIVIILFSFFSCQWKKNIKHDDNLNRENNQASSYIEKIKEYWITDKISLKDISNRNTTRVNFSGFVTDFHIKNRNIVQVIENKEDSLNLICVFSFKDNTNYKVLYAQYLGGSSPFDFFFVFNKNNYYVSSLDFSSFEYDIDFSLDKNGVLYYEMFIENENDKIKNNYFLDEKGQFIKFEYKIKDPDGFANLREQPNTTSKIISKIINGTYVCLIDNAPNNWYYVYVLGIGYGYLHKSRLITE